MRLFADGIVRDSGLPDPVVASAVQHAVEDLPPETIVYLLGSRYCETDRLSDIAWKLFENTPPGWARVRSICDFVHSHIAFGYEHARPTMTAFEAFNEGKGVCRDYAHLAIAFCRCMNIPARYCTGYLGDIGVPLNPDPMDFSAWFEAFLDGRWYAFDARHNQPRIGRVVEGTVDHGAAPGIFVQLEPGLTGLIPNSEISVAPGADPSKAYQPGEKLLVRVMSLDPSRKRISLSHEAAKAAAEREEYVKFAEDRGEAAEGESAMALAFRRAMEKKGS